MDLHLVVLPFVLAFSLANTNQCVSSTGSGINVSLHSLKNASGHWIMTVDTRRFTRKQNPRELTVNVHQETRLCDSNEIEQLVSVAFVYPSHDSSMPGANESTAPLSNTPSTIITAASSTTTTATSPTTTSTTTTTTTPKSCPHPGYQLFPEFNCYKVFASADDGKTWSDAREQCRRDGGDLMVIETEQEREKVYFPLYEFVGYPWVGVYIPQGGDDWMTVKGEPVLSAWWAPVYQGKRADYRCAYAYYTGLLGSYACAESLNFICEIPLSDAHQHPEKNQC